MAIDEGIVTIYDLESGSKPLLCHRIDAKEFLKHPRWSISPEGVKSDGVAKPLENKEDSGEVMQLKAMDLKALQAMANKAGIADYEKLKKADLVVALDTARQLAAD